MVGRSMADSYAALLRGINVSGKNKIYLRCPNGCARSKLTNAWFDAKLGVTSTVRNWRTVLKLVEMTAPGD